MTFKAGESGNPSGRPRGIKDKRLGYLSALESGLPELIGVVQTKAMGGDMTAAKMLLDKLLPSPRAEGRRLALARGCTLTEDAQAIVQGIFNGTVAPDVGASLLAALTSVVKIKEVDELTRRIGELESARRP